MRIPRKFKGFFFFWARAARTGVHLVNTIRERWEFRARAVDRSTANIYTLSYIDSIKNCKGAKGKITSPCFARQTFAL